MPNKNDLIRAILEKNPGANSRQVAKIVGCNDGFVRNVLRTMRLEAAAQSVPSEFLFQREIPKKAKIIFDNCLGGKWLRYGLVADTHLGCREERLAELHATYDLFEKEGITTVFHAGNPVDGYIEKINGTSAIVTTVDGQAAYMALNYPKRKGITTYFITGDDHEGWWIKKGINWGAYCEHVCRKHGRTDLVYIGHVEADVTIRGDKGTRPTIIKVQHPGGGSAYARSYTQQKQIEAFEGGEKPDILIQGHYHVSNFMMDRGVICVSMPGFQDQTIFARKKRLRMEVGGAILEFKRDKRGSVHRCRIEWIRYFNRGFYKNFIPSDEIFAPRLEL